MSDLDPGLKTILERAVPPVDGNGADWEDVLRRAEGGERRHDSNLVRLGTRRRRRACYAFAAAVLLTVLLVNPAFGVGDRIVDWFTGSPAPEHVKEELAEMNAPEEVKALFSEPGVRAEEARGVMAIETRRGPAYLWAAPTETGGWCTYVEFETEDGGMAGVGCDATPPDEDPLVVGMSTDMSGDERLSLLEGRVRPPVDSVELRFTDDSTEAVPFVDGFFIYEVPASREPLVLIGRDAEGEIVARESIPTGHTGPDEDEEWQKAGPWAYTRKLIEIQTSIGKKAALFANESRVGDEHCYGIEVGENGYSGDYCTTIPDRVVTHVAEDVRGQEKPLVLLHGFVAPRVASLHLRFQDGEVVALRLVDGFFLYELPRRHYGDGRLPKVFIARDRHGRVVGRVAAAGEP